MIDFCGVSIKYGNNWILRNINARIESGERVVITGPSGSGKSSMLNTLTGIHQPIEGEVRFQNQVISQHNIDQIRRQIAYIGQEPFLGAAGVEDSLYLPFDYRNHRHMRPPREEVNRILESLHLPMEILTKTNAVISGGEKQRIAIARALLLKKRVFVLDEITSALDQESIDAVLELFSDSRYTLLSVSHEPKWIQFCTRRLIMNQGRLENDGASCEQYNPAGNENDIEEESFGSH